MITLYDYFRSTTSYRVRIALNLKKVDYDLQEVHLVNDGGQQHSADYKKVNPQELVPTLVDGDVTLSQSIAILSYLDAKFPEPKLIYGDIAQQAQIQSMANIIACDIHPLDNLRVLKYLKNTLEVSDEQKNTWYHHWIKLGFAVIEKKIDEEGQYCFGEQVSLADICLIPQVYNAHRFELDMTPYPKIERVHKACLQLEAFVSAAPTRPVGNGASPR